MGKKETSMNKKYIKYLGIIFILTAIIFAFVFKFNTEHQRYKWYEKMVIYHILPKAFNDSDGDGIGDFNGITEKLDYIKSLGVNTIYLMPIMDSLTDETKLRSNYGYEVKNLKSINPDLGTKEDFQRLLKEAKKRDLRVVIDFVTTVISVENFIFKDILEHPDTSKYKDWIITSDKPLEGNWMNFNDYANQFTSSAWNKLPNGRYYYSLWGKSPFLQFYNQEVQDYILSVMDFWLDMGVDGFRVDATKHLFINGPGEELQFHQPENFVFWRKMKKHLMDKYGPDKVLIAETIPIPYNMSYKEDNRATFDAMLGNTITDEFWPYRKIMFSEFLTSDYIATAFVNNLKYQINKLQDRIYYNSDHDGARIASRFINPTMNELKLAASLLILTPVQTKIYFGDEIGLEGLSDRSANRPDFWLHTPSHTMAWNKSKNGGFSSADKTLMPISEDYFVHNVELQKNDKNSLLSYYKELIKLKNKYDYLFFKGDIGYYPFFDKKVYTYFLNNGDDYALVVSNLSNQYKYFKLNLEKYLSDVDLDVIFKSNDAIKFKNKNGVIYFEKLPSYATIVFKFKDKNHKKFMDLFNASPDFEQNTIIENYNTELTSSSDKVVYITMPNTSIYIPKHQGSVAIDAYIKIKEKGNDVYYLVYKNTFDTNKSDEDLFIPLADNIKYVHIKNSDIKYKLVNVKNIINEIDNKIKNSTYSNKNDELTYLGIGEDNNFLYIKVGIKDWIMEKNSGLDFSVLISDKKNPNGISELEFWKLPMVKTSKPIVAMINFERHINTLWLLNNLSITNPAGMDNSQSLIKIINGKDMYILIAKNLLSYNGDFEIASFVWSAGGKWGDSPKKGKFPVVERLPVVKGIEPNMITKFIGLK